MNTKIKKKNFTKKEKKIKKYVHMNITLYTWAKSPK